MIIGSPDAFRERARRRLPRFLFDYIDGGSYAELTLARNVSDLRAIELRQRVLAGSETIDTTTKLLGETVSLPLALAPVGLTGMYARRGEVQAARAGERAGVPFCLSSVSVCSIDEVAAAIQRPIWFQLYVLKDRGFMRHVLQRAEAAGVKTLVFTVDLPVPGARYRDASSGMGGRYAPLRRLAQILSHPCWAMDVGLMGRPHDLGNISDYRGQKTGLGDYINWLSSNFEPAITWSDLDWIRQAWPGKLVIKGILDPSDVEDAIRLGADGIIVSNHGGRQLDGVPSSIRALPHIVEAVGGRASVLMDGGIRSGLDVIRALCLGAEGVLIGRSYIYALADSGQAGVASLLATYASEMRVAMTLMGVESIAQLSPGCLIGGEGY